MMTESKLNMDVGDIPTPWIDTIGDERPTSLDYEEVSPFEFVKRAAQSQPDDPAMIFPKGKTVTYGELLTSVKKMAVFLSSLGIKKGDRISLLLPNTPHYVVCHYALQAIGAIIVQSNPIYTDRELIDQIEDSGARGMITLSLFQDKANKVKQHTDMEFIIVGQISDYLSWLTSFLGRLLKKLDDPAIEEIPDNYVYSEVLSQADISQFKEAEIDIYNDVALLQYTGGTTGKSKGAMLTYANISCNAQQARAIIHMIPERSGSILTVLPLFHSFALTICLGNSFQMKVPMVLMPRFNAGDVLDYIEKYKITFFPAVPTMMIALLDHEKMETTDFSSLIAVLSGGAALPLEVAREFQKKTGADLVEGYGLSESSPVAHANPVQSDKIKPIIGSIGLPVADTFAKIVDSEDFTVLKDIGEVGEICLKGPQVFKGYWDDEENTNKALVDGWLRTGDLAKMDEKGYFYIVDRKKDIIIVSGYNVVPRDIEEVLYEHPKVKEAAVAGLPHDKKGEMVAAWIVLKEGQTATVEEFTDYCKENLAPYKIPKQIIFREELPKSMIGKILRRELVEQETGNS